MTYLTIEQQQDVTGRFSCVVIRPTGALKINPQTIRLSAAPIRAAVARFGRWGLVAELHHVALNAGAALLEVLGSSMPTELGEVPVSVFVISGGGSCIAIVPRVAMATRQPTLPRKPSSQEGFLQTHPIATGVNVANGAIGARLGVGGSVPGLPGAGIREDALRGFQTQSAVLVDFRTQLNARWVSELAQLPASPATANPVASDQEKAAALAARMEQAAAMMKLTQSTHSAWYTIAANVIAKLKS
jgi:hypothetical protein